MHTSLFRHKSFSIPFSFVLLLVSSCSPSKTDQETVKTNYIHRYGVQIDEKDWNANGGSGVVVQTQLDGTVIKRTYRDGTLNGVSTFTFPHSTIVQKAQTYADGTLVSEMHYYLSGMPMQENTYHDENAISTTFWYEDGLVRATEEHIAGSLKNGRYYSPQQEQESEVVEYNGSRMVRDGLGILLVKETIEDGHPTIQEKFYSNGVLHAATSYANGKIHGTKRTFFPSGEPQTIEEWQNDKLHGIKEVFQNGEKIKEISYSNGKKQGIEKRFKDGTNTIVEEVTWADDKKHGPQVVFIDGAKITQWYYKGQKVSKVQFFERDLENDQASILSR